jgi:surface carbohydrate biosynthesis protein
MDVQVRELHSKILLASKAVDRGYNVLIGKKHLVDSCALVFPPGDYLGFALVENLHDRYKKLKSYGHAVHSMDEEGLVRFSDKIYSETRLHSPSVTFIESIISCGISHTNLIEKTLPGSGSKIITCGNPRYDLLVGKYVSLFDKEIHEIRAKFGSFVLINSSFPISSLYKDADEYASAINKKSLINSETDSEWYKQRYEYKKSTYCTLVQAIDELASSLPGTNFVIRLHPSEVPGVLWQSLQKRKNIHVVKDGAIYPWLAASQAVIHHDCTTAIEAYLLHKPVIAFNPSNDARFEIQLPKLVSTEVKTVSEMASLVNEIMNESPYSALSEDKLECHLDTVRTRTPASEQIIDVLAKKNQSPPARINKFKLFHQQLKFLKNGARRKINTLGRDQAAPSKYLDVKFPGIKDEDVRFLFEQIRQIDRSANVKIKKLHDSLYLIKADD